MKGRDSIYIFVDNSNIFIEAQKAVARIKNDENIGKRYRLDFGKLFKFIANGRGEYFLKRPDNRIYPKLYGSEPPKLDSLWDRLEDMGVDLNIYKRKWNKEKRVDAALIRDVEQLLYRYRRDPKGVIVIAAGDYDYFDLIKDIQNARQWNVEVYCWEASTAKEIRQQSYFHDLTKHFHEIGFIEKDRFEHSFGDWNTDWSKEVPYYDEPKKPKRGYKDGKRIRKRR